MPDQTIKCVECKKDFNFSEKDQDFYAKQGYQPPRRCRLCRDKRKAEKSGKA